MLFLIIVAQIFTTTYVRADKRKVLVLPIEIYSDQDMSFLQKGIQATITSRLSKDNQAQPIGFEKIKKALDASPGMVDQSKAIALARNLDADYVIFGSITILGGGFSIDIQCNDVARNQPVLALNQSGNETSEILQQIHGFTDQLNTAWISGDKGITPAVSGKSTYKNSQSSPEQLTSIQHNPKPAENPSTTIIVPAYQPRSISLDVMAQINGMTVDDVDGDRRNEVVLVADQSVLVYRLSEGRLVSAGQFKGQGAQRYLSVDAADINQNGRAEIFVTPAPAADEPLRSFVLEYNGNKFEKIADNQKWYYRVLESPNGGKILVGQKRGSAIDPMQKSRAFHGPIYELKWTGEGYQKADVVKLPLMPASLYHFAFGHPKLSPDRAAVISSDNQRLKILNSDGGEEWVSDDAFGRTANYLEVSNPDVVNEIMRNYIPARIIYSDVDNDGRSDLIAVKNRQALGGILRNSQILDGGRIECLNWDGREMAPAWQTRNSSKYISDFAVADIDNDGRRELIYAVVKAGKSGLKKGKSQVISEELP